MRILVCHNFYQQPGGEDQVFAAEVAMLRAHGHDVSTFEVHNDAVQTMSKLQAAAATLWNRRIAADLRLRLRRHHAEIVHFHNTFPLISPAAYYVARAEGAAVVQTLHNYRLLCPAATLFRNGGVCEKCVGHLPVAAVAHACYRQSRTASAVTAAMLTVHRVAGTYSHNIDAYIALTQFARDKFVQAGFAADRIQIKPNFLDPDPGIGAGDGAYALFVGRLTQEKGIEPLLAAWEKVGHSFPLKICGDGPLAAKVQQAAGKTPSIQWLGRQPLEKIIDLMGRAVMLVFPSLWYEGLPRTIVESFATGTPVAASDLGSMKELIDPGKTGVLFHPGDPEDMARQILHLAGDGPALAAMRLLARQEFVNQYTPQRNHDMLMNIYRRALDRRAAAHPTAEAATA